eukprot:TRINITY_DN5718_c0_g1_i1.p1 TRINITY_DN5718_c0_g1~~TRINITY_DN5718_c0_g1_i1.p1  ORF type:complete len:818 (-),score=112.47 TRINITY_DN5718_c0_g1_i1:92-2545(-)
MANECFSKGAWWTGLFLMCLLLLLSETNGLTLKLGLVTISGDVDSEQTRHAAEIAAAEIKNSFDFDFEFIEFQVPNRSVANIAIMSLYEQSVIGVVGPPRTSLNLVTAVTGGDFFMPTLSPTATIRDLSDKTTYPYFLRTIPSDTLQAQAIIQTCLHFKWKEVAVIATTEAYSVSITQDLATQAALNDIKILTSIYFNSGKTDLSVELENIRATGVRIIVAVMLLNDFRNLMYIAEKSELTGPPYVYLGTDGTSSPTIAINPNGERNKTVEKAVRGSLATSPRIRGGLNQTKRIDKLYSRLIKGLMKGVSATDFRLGPYATYTYDAVFTYAYAIKSYLSSNPSTANLPTSVVSSIEYVGQTSTNSDLIDRRVLLRELLKVDFQGLTGRIQFLPNGDRTNAEYSINNFRRGKNATIVLEEVGVWRYQTNEVTIYEDIEWPGDENKVPDSTPKGPVDYYNCETNFLGTDPRGLVEIKDVDHDPDIIVADSYCDAIVDCANWSDEGFHCGSSLSIAMIVLGIATIVLLMIILVYLYIIFRYWKRGRIRASGNLCLKVIAFSSFVGLLSVYTYFGKAHTYVCQLRIWLWFPSAGMIVGVLSTKQYRVWRVFGNSSLRKTVMTENTLLGVTLLLNVPIFVILTIWTATDTYGRYSINDDTGQHVVCGSDLEILFFALLLGYLLTLLAVSSILAFITRNYPSAFSESKLIGFALYNCTLVICVLVPIVGVLQAQNLTAWVAAVLTVMFFFSSTITIIMSPKIWGIYITDRGTPLSELEKLPDSYASKHTRSKQTTGNGGQVLSSPRGGRPSPPVHSSGTSSSM